MVKSVEITKMIKEITNLVKKDPPYKYEFNFIYITFFQLLILTNCLWLISKTLNNLRNQTFLFCLIFGLICSSIILITYLSQLPNLLKFGFKERVNKQQGLAFIILGIIFPISFFIYFEFIYSNSNFLFKNLDLSLLLFNLPNLIFCIFLIISGIYYYRKNYKHLLNEEIGFQNSREGYISIGITFIAIGISFITILLASWIKQPVEIDFFAIIINSLIFAGVFILLGTILIMKRSSL